jgi:branched-chain amino acid transport system substrate-binding protein
VDGEYAVRRLGSRRIAIIDDGSTYGKGLADEFEKAAKNSGAEIVTREYTNDKAFDFMAVLTNVKRRSPELLFFGGMDAQSGPMVKQMKDLGITAKFMTGSGSCTPTLIKLAGDAAEGVYCSRAGMPVDKMPRGKEFQRRFTERYGDIQNYAPYAYDAVHVMIAAMKAAGSVQPEKYLLQLGKVDYSGVTARILFDSNGDLKTPSVTLFQGKNGKLEPLETVTFSPK